MKTTMLAILIVLAVGTAFAQDTTAVPAGNFYADSLKSSSYPTTVGNGSARDTLDVQFSSAVRPGYYSISLYTSTGTDTVNVYTYSPNRSFWVKHGMVDLSDNSDVTQIIITTTAKEFVVLDREPVKIRLTTADHTYNTRFVVCLKVAR